ncbi:spore germination protein KA [Clostridium acidisoli DSM 12555]|uniref:Spore germination protein KA n=1 Tax=Clostridium acidisoli DSM 12555 TaxID=1121291 RepID=A0A1W1XSL9_9CLOT|nr:spore germination protein [Clostridium acidisoli]SMC26960.1 spore germination protein KA [Clostridium acidisoli DSM 12555]
MDKKTNNKNKESTIYADIDINLNNLKKIIGKSDDIVFREFKISEHIGIRAFACFVEGLVDKEVLDFNIIRTLIHENITMVNNIERSLVDSVFSTMNSTVEKDFNKVLNEILSGKVALFIDSCCFVIIMDIRKWAQRNIEEPNTEAAVRGSREGFTETLRVNTAMIRRIIESPNLVFEPFAIGKRTNTKINIAYIDDVADMKVVDEVRQRLSRIDTDAILESGYVEQFIEDNSFSLFATVGNSERPDKVAAKILEGRIAILCDGTPFVLTVPHLFIENFQVNEDYYSRPFLSSLIRLIRLLAFITNLTLPAVYIAIETFHQEMIPTVLILTAASAREQTPFPAVVEVIIMEIFFQLIRESGVRMPRSLGQTVSIIGTLVIGEAVVQAGIIGAPMIIISALSSICSFIIPSIFDSTTCFRYILIVLSSIAGLYGIILGIIFMIVHLCSLRSFGSPYFSPIAPMNLEGLKDSFIRAPLWLMKLRPKSITWKNLKKQKVSTLKPNKPNKPDEKNGGWNK